MVIFCSRLTFIKDGWIIADSVLYHPSFVPTPYPVGPEGTAHIDYRSLAIGKAWSERSLYLQFENT